MMTPTARSNALPLKAKFLEFLPHLHPLPMRSDARHPGPQRASFTLGKRRLKAIEAARQIGLWCEVRMFYSWTVLFAGLAYVGAPVRGGELRRPPGARPAARYAAALHLCPFARRLLHLLDLFRQRRRRLALGAGFPAHLYRPDPGLRRRLEAARRRSSTSPSARTSPRSPISSRRAMARTRCWGRWWRSSPSVGIIPYISIQLKAVSFALETMMVTPGWSTASATAVADQRGHRLLRHRRHGGLRHAVRHPPYRHDRASAWADDGDRGRIRWSSSLAFLAVGLFITFAMMGGPQALFEQAPSGARHRRLVHQGL